VLGVEHAYRRGVVVSSLPLHPALVHLPIGAALVAPLAAVAVLVAIRRAALPRKTWWLVVALQGVVFAGGLAAAQAGDRDEHAVQRIVGRGPVHAHEERAEAFLWAAGATVAVAAATSAFPAAPLAFMTCAALGSFATAGLAVYTGHAGGELVYARGAATAFVSGGAPVPIAVEEGGERHDGRLRVSLDATVR
jgi:uncharacterized membrane protein